jgi:hypothetical protein
MGGAPNGREPNFKVFDRRSVPVTATPLITLQARANFSLNKKAYEDLGSPKFVELLYDESLNIIGFRPTDPTKPHAYPVKVQSPRGSNYYIAGKAFCDFHGIDTGVSRRYVARSYGDDVIGIDLNDEPVKSNVTRARKG